MNTLLPIKFGFQFLKSARSIEEFYAQSNVCIQLEPSSIVSIPDILLRPDLRDSEHASEIRYEGDFGIQFKLSDSVTQSGSYMYRLKNAVVLPQRAHVMVNNTFMFDRIASASNVAAAMQSYGRYFGFEFESESIDIEFLRKIGESPFGGNVIKHVEEPSILISNDINDRCITHWLMQKGSEFQLFREAKVVDVNPIFIFGYQPAGWQLEIMQRLLGVYSTIRLGIISEPTIFSNLLVPKGRDQTLLDRRLHRAICSSFTRSDSKYLRRIYISRSDASTRRMINEDIFEDYLSAIGFTKIIMTMHSIAEQISFFATAEEIIFIDGSHGIFSLFARPETIFYIISPFPDGGATGWTTILNSIGDFRVRTFRAVPQNSLNSNSDFYFHVDSTFRSVVERPNSRSEVRSRPD